MAIDRRHLLKALSGAAVAASPFASRAQMTQADPVFAAARRDGVGAFWISTFDATGRIVGNARLPARGHDIASCRASRRSVAFARRPGRFAVAFDARGDHAETVFFAPANRHFFGHGVFSHDGRLLFSTENDFDAGAGVIGVYDASSGYRRIGEFSSFGVGPHDIALLRDGRTLVVANGGHREHPDIGGGRRVLNANAFETTLSYIDVEHGTLLERHCLVPKQSVSVRHLAVVDNDHIVLGGQTETVGSAANVLISHRRGEQPRTLPLSPETTSSLAGYVSSLAVSRDGHAFAATSSKGGAAVVFDPSTGSVIRTFALADVSGIAASEKRAAFVVSSGFGSVQRIDGGGQQRPLALNGTLHWDNHLRAL